MISSLFYAFILYFVVLIGIAIVVYHRNKRASDYMLGGRSMNYFVTAIAAQASDMSSWLFLAFPAAVFINGLFELWTAIGLVFFMYLNWTFIAPRLRSATQEYNSNTLSSYFARRFNDTSGTLEIISACMNIFFFTCYIAASLVGIGRLFQGSFDLSLYMSMLIGLLIALIYTMVGGFLAVAWCNVFKGLFMLAVIVAIPLYALSFVGGIDGVINAAHTLHLPLTLFSADKNIFSSLLLIAGWGLGYFGQPHILIYFMGIDDVKNITYSKYVGITWQIIALAAATSIGLIGAAYFNGHLAVPETLFITLAKDLFSPFVAGIALCGIFAATLASMNNHILIAGSSIAEDIYKRCMKKTFSAAQTIWAARMGAIAVCAAAYALVYFGNINSIYNLVVYAWSGLGSSFGPTLICALYNVRISRWGAIAGITAGGITAALWPLLNTTIFPIIPGFMVSFIALMSVSCIINERKSF